MTEPVAAPSVASLETATDAGTSATPGRRVLAVFRHPTPYRDPLLDRLAATPGIDLTVIYLDRGFSETPWTRQPLAHAAAFPRGFLPFTVGELRVAVHPGAIRLFLRLRPEACILSGWADPTVIAIALACRAMHVPYALAGESYTPSRLRGAAGWLRARLVRCLVTGASSWLPAGTRARENFVRLGANEARCHFFPTSPDAREWMARVEAARAAVPTARERLGLPPDGVITYVGRLVPDKGPDIVVEGFRRLHARRPDLRLVIVGDGPMRPALERDAAGLAVRFLGFLQPAEVAAVLAASDVVVLASRQETWGAAPCEALAAGLPVVLSDAVGAAPDLAGPGDVGAIVPTGDATALADALERVLDDPERRRGLPERARRRSLAWGHDLALASLQHALRECGLDVSAPTGDAGSERQLRHVP